MKLTIYHNPRCSKSRATLALLNERGVSAEVVRYLDEPPTAARILELAGRLDVPVRELLRSGEIDYKQAADQLAGLDDAELAAWLHAHPSVLQRPIVADDEQQRAVIGRPPENVLALLD